MKKIQLSIPAPCYENWDAMTPTRQGRYCNACAKEVIDFSNMSDSEVLHYFLKKKNDTVCGRVFPDQLARAITAPAIKKWYWRWQYAAALFLFFSKPNAAAAQKKAAHPVTALPGLQKKTPLPVGEMSFTKNITVAGRVIDSAGNAVPYASIKVRHTQNGVSADGNGQFSITMENDPVIIEVSRLGYIQKEVVVTDSSDLQIILTRCNEMLQEVVITQNLQGRMMGGLSSCRVSRMSILTDTIKAWGNTKPSITIYPNPVQKGNFFTVNMKLKKAGVYTILLSDAAGRSLTETKITTALKEFNQQVGSNVAWSAGVYYVKVMDEKGKIAGTGSVLLQ